MTKPLDPYSRVYWRVLDDGRFDNVRSDMRHFGSWTLMLLVADMAYPAPAFVPSTVPKASLAQLTECGLIEMLPGGLFRVHGLRAERDRRGTRADPDGTPTGPGAAPVGTPRARVRRDETSKDETRLDEHTQDGAPEVGLSDYEGLVFGFIAQHGASIREDSPLGRRLLGLMERRTPEAVLKEATAMAQIEDVMSDRQWVLGLENGLEAIPSGRKSVDAVIEEETRARNDARYDRMVERRLDYLRETGRWPEEWGPRPILEEVPNVRP